MREAQRALGGRSRGGNGFRHLGSHSHTAHPRGRCWCRCTFPSCPQIGISGVFSTYTECTATQAQCWLQPRLPRHLGQPGALKLRHGPHVHLPMSLRAAAAPTQLQTPFHPQLPWTDARLHFAPAVVTSLLLTLFGQWMSLCVTRCGGGYRHASVMRAKNMHQPILRPAANRIAACSEESEALGRAAVESGECVRPARQVCARLVGPGRATSEWQQRLTQLTHMSWRPAGRPSDRYPGVAAQARAQALQGSKVVARDSMRGPAVGCSPAISSRCNG